MSAPAIAVLCSGQGTNLQAIINAIQRGRLRARLAVVITDNPRAYALVRARKAGIPAAVIDPRRYRSRQRFDQELARIIAKAKAQWVVLAGFMRILSPWMVRRYKGRILNIHPALLPAFPGMHAIRDALHYGVKVTGVTVHLVDEKIDHGPIVLQGTLPIRDGETETSLTQRVHRLEHRLYSQAIELLVQKRLKLRGRKIIQTARKRR